ncbi:ABC transporter permease [Nguyenibacter vanlangensis]|uniref:ABC transporter permease n=2 Tax=Nguyenibacter vanlangensis TaxID=1216886 RepID=A0A7Y7IWA2_9PROT|nr:ABC transporter permease [Nguyenibacter vanlangensis]
MRAVTRTLARQKLYTAINVAGLALGISVFVTMSLIVRYEFGYDAYLPNTDSIYRADIVWRLPGSAPEEWPVASFFATSFLKQDFAGISDTLRVWPRTTAIRIRNGASREPLTQADANFFSFFHLAVVSGNETQALTRPDWIAIPASLALKYFGTTQAVGKTMTLLDDGRTHIVSLVYADPPANTSFSFGIIELVPPDFIRRQMSTPESGLTYWGSTPGTLWVRIPNERDVDTIETGIARYVTRHPSAPSVAQARAYWGDSGLHLVGLRELHFHDAAIGWGGMHRQLVVILGLVGLSALATAAVNYVNMATARAGIRAREVAMRKVLGGTRRNLVAQFLSEAICLVASAAFIGLSLVELSLRSINVLGGWHVTLAPSFTLPLLVIITLGVGTLAGLYPAFVLSSFRPAAVLATGRMPAGGRMASMLRNVLVTSQFTFAIALAVCTLVMKEQAYFVQHLARGIRTDGIIILDADGSAGRESAILQRLRAVPGVLMVERSNLYPHHLQSGGVFIREGTGATRSELAVGHVSSGFLDLYGFQLVAGRWFDPARSDDFEDPASSSDRRSDVPFVQGVVISALAAQRLGFPRIEDAYGQIIREASDPTPLRIIGIVRDVRLSGPHDSLRPVIFYGIRATGHMTADVAWQVRYSGVNEGLEMARLRAAWEDILPDTPIQAQSVPDILSADYRTDRNHSLLFGIGSAIAIGIACLGLYGLSIFHVSHRMHEIGIRKVLGARTRDILFLLSTQFIRPITIANLIAWPLAWGIMRHWLDTFDQRITLTPVPFVLVTAAATLIAALTIAVQTWRAARKPPGATLRQI